MTGEADAEGLLRELAPQALGVVGRRYGNFADAEDAVQEALVAAATTWPSEGRPDNPLAWLVRVASRRMADQFRRDDARRRREDLAASWSMAAPDPSPSHDDTLVLLFMCCHPTLTPAASIPLALRAVAGLTTAEIAKAFLVPEATMAQRISRAKARLRASNEPFSLPSPAHRAERLRSVLHVVYLLFNEGYASSSGDVVARSDLSGEAIRLARGVHAALPDDDEVAGLLALMLLTDARRPARTSPDGDLVPLSDQDRSRWNRSCIDEGMALLDAPTARPPGEYRVQAEIAAVHDRAARYADTDWPAILHLYEQLDGMTGNPMVALNRAVAAAMTLGPNAGLELLEGLATRLGGHHRLHAVRAHLLEMAGDSAGAIDEFRMAAAGTKNLREQQYLTTEAARLSAQTRAVE